MRHHGRALWIGLIAACASGAKSSHVSHPTTDLVSGAWQGSAVLKDARLDFSLRLTRTGATTTCTMSCADLLLLDQPMTGVQVTGSKLRFTTPDDHPLQFEGVADRDSLRGTATVPAVPGVVKAGGAAVTLRFALGRAPAAAAPPYASREVHFANGRIRLAGTLLVPTSGGPRHAGVVILQGSSTNLRRDYKYFADRFARAGLAVLAFDKRGNGESSGDYTAASYDALAGDAAAAVQFLRTQAGVDSQRVGVWGLSQGAFIAPLVCARVPAVRFLVAISAPGMPLGESAAYQDSARLVAAGFDEADVRRTTTIDRWLYDWLRSGEDEAELAAMLREAADTPWRRASSLPAKLPSGTALEGWYWRGRTLDPLPAWRQVHVPVLALYGAADELIPARASARAVEGALHKGRNHHVSVDVYPAANHVLRTLPLVAGGKWDWPRAVPGYMDKVTSWMLEQTRLETETASHTRHKH